MTTRHHENARGVVLRDSLLGRSIPPAITEHVTSSHLHWLGGARLSEVLILDIPAEHVDMVARVLAEKLRPEGFFAHMVSKKELTVVFPNCIERAAKGDTEAFLRLRTLGESLGIPRSQMPLEGLFDSDHPNAAAGAHPSGQILEHFRDDCTTSGRTPVFGRVLERTPYGEGSLVLLRCGDRTLTVRLSSPPPEINDIIAVSGLTDAKGGGVTEVARWAVITPGTAGPDVAGAAGLRETALLTDQALRDNLAVRRKVVRAIRNFLEAKDFVEAETPIILPVRDVAPIEHLELKPASSMDGGFLRICPENHLKRLVVGGYDKVFEIARNFRDDKAGARHLPEFTSLECYQAFSDYRGMADLCRELVIHAVRSVTGKTTLTVEGREVDLAAPWCWVRYSDAARDAVGFDPCDFTELEELMSRLRQAGVDVAGAVSRRDAINCLTERIERDLPQLCILCDHPAETICVVKRKGERPDLIERFEVFVGGLELAHAFSELNDPQEQRERMSILREEKIRGGAPWHPLDEDFLKSLELGLPPTGGLGIGLDRLIMLITGDPIHRVVAFPGQPEQRKG